MSISETSAHLECIETDCRTRYPINRRIYTCTECGGLLDVGYEFHLQAGAEEIKAIFRDRKMSQAELDLSGVWRFRELLPLVRDPSEVVTLGEGNTPLYDGPRSAGF